MTRWLPEGAVSGGRDRGVMALVRAWATVLVRPREFFREVVVPGDQAPGLTFAVFVVIIEEAIRYVFQPAALPVFAGQHFLSALLVLGASGLLVAPAALHLVAAVQTVLLVPFVENRAGVSETVQVVAYSTAPCVLAGVPVPEIRGILAFYGAYLFVVGMSEVHGVRFESAVFLSAVPAAVVFGYGFRGFAAIATLLRRWYII